VEAWTVDNLHTTSFTYNQNDLTKYVDDNNDRTRKLTTLSLDPQQSSPDVLADSHTSDHLLNRFLLSLLLVTIQFRLQLKYFTCLQTFIVGLFYTEYTDIIYTDNTVDLSYPMMTKYNNLIVNL